MSRSGSGSTGQDKARRYSECCVEGRGERVRSRQRGRGLNHCHSDETHISGCCSYDGWMAHGRLPAACVPLVPLGRRRGAEAASGNGSHGSRNGITKSTRVGSSRADSAGDPLRRCRQRPRSDLQEVSTAMEEAMLTRLDTWTALGWWGRGRESGSLLCLHSTHFSIVPTAFSACSTLQATARARTGKDGHPRVVDGRANKSVPRYLGKAGQNRTDWCQQFLRSETRDFGMFSQKISL